MWLVGLVNGYSDDQWRGPGGDPAEIRRDTMW